jgi:hypothetical protein
LVRRHGGIRSLSNDRRFFLQAVLAPPLNNLPLCCLDDIFLTGLQADHVLANGEEPVYPFTHVV